LKKLAFFLCGSSWLTTAVFPRPPRSDGETHPRGDTHFSICPFSKSCFDATHLILTIGSSVTEPFIDLQIAGGKHGTLFGSSVEIVADLLRAGAKPFVEKHQPGNPV
jgi:hypothetical protein